MNQEFNTYKLPSGYRVYGFKSGIKTEKLDTAVILSDLPGRGAGVFTKNQVRAACVDRNRELLSGNSNTSAIVVNSGNANACTGEKGVSDNIRVAEETAALLKSDPDSVLTASTGIIGVPLPADKLINGISSNWDKIDNSSESYRLAAEAILTTDTKPKQTSIEVQLDGRTVTVSGFAKGSGMIHPNMATMLAFIMTDAAVTGKMLQEIISSVTDSSFNMISVDGDTSTNDMFLLTSNGAAGNREIDSQNGDFKLLLDAVSEIAVHLAKAIAADGEGATKLLEIEAVNCRSKEDAVLIAKSVACSSLVKTAMFGEDPNWGRILAAAGYSGAKFNPETVSIYFQGLSGYVCVFDKGEPHHFDKETAESILAGKEINITVNMNSGDESATAWGCDFSYDYVKINADYHT